jgi:predicted phosphodiesterase
MRIACLADTHGNVHALAAVLAEVEQVGVDGYWLLGDYASGPAPAPCLDLLVGLPGPVLAVRGNADREVLDTRHGRHRPLPDDADDDTRLWRERDEWVAAQLTDEHVRWLAGHPLTQEATGPGGPVLLAHATAAGDEELITPESPDEALVAAFAGSTATLLLCGHIHLQYRRSVGGRGVANVGSVGLPYEGDPAAFWALLTDDGVELRRTAYDVAAAADDYRTNGFPGGDDYADTMLLEPPSREEAIAVFEQRRGASAGRCC